MENRNLMIEHCISHNLSICNTWFKKPKCKTVTFNEIGTTMADDYTRGKHEQLDFITIQHRWKKSGLEHRIRYSSKHTHGSLPSMGKIPNEAKSRNIKKTGTEGQI